MQVTTTDFKLNLDKYLKLVQTEDILITKNGKPVAKLINPIFLLLIPSLVPLQEESLEILTDIL